jgi:hypothetical protein
MDSITLSLDITQSLRLQANRYLLKPVVWSDTVSQKLGYVRKGTDIGQIDVVHAKAYTIPASQNIDINLTDLSNTVDPTAPALAVMTGFFCSLIPNPDGTIATRIKVGMGEANLFLDDPDFELTIPGPGSIAWFGDAGVDPKATGTQFFIENPDNLRPATVELYIYGRSV